MEIRTGKLFKPGTLVFLDYPAGTRESNYFVYLDRRGNMFELVRAGLNESGRRIVRTEERAALHIDFEECLKPVLGIVVR